MNPGIHLVHKPVGATSFSIVQRYLAAAREESSRVPSICHGGAIDPFASGLLLILIEPATQLFEHLHAVPKAYRATIRWGVETDNGDPLGKVVSEADASKLTVESIDAAMQAHVGWQEQIPPTTSNKRIGGERAYLKAHRGETFELPPSKVYLHQYRWLQHNLPQESSIEITVRGGYYVRSLARDLGRQLGCGAHLSELSRLSIGPWNDPGVDQVVELHGREILPWAPARVLTDQEVGEFRQKRDIGIGIMQPPEWKLPEGFPDPQAPIRGFHQGTLRFLMESKEGRLKLKSIFKGGL